LGLEPRQFPQSLLSRYGLAAGTPTLTNFQPEAHQPTGEEALMSVADYNDAPALPYSACLSSARQALDQGVDPRVRVRPVVSLWKLSAEGLHGKHRGWSALVRQRLQVLDTAGN